jgi:HEAT repeat protein/energy-coupling factor transporter ATP-binding protein EcfA2
MPSAFWEEYDYFKKYFNAMKADFETIKDISAIGKKELVPLENIYVSLKVSEKIKRSEVLCDSIEFTIKLKERESPIEKERTIVDEKTEPRKEERRAERERILDAERAVKEFDKLVIVGALGSGKTTLLKHLALKTCKENLEKLERTCVPIPITLREFSESGKDLKQYIDEVFEKYQFPKAKEFVEKDLNNGKCQLLLDGFDELATKERQENVAAEIREFMEKYPKCQFIVTSRIAGYHDELRGFTKLELMEFDDKQIEKFIENWFGETNPKKAKSMLAAIKENEQIKTLARNPLMIAIIAFIYEEDRALPQKRAKLYERCVEVLLSKWDVQKRLKNKYPPEEKEFILRKLAFYAHSNNKKVLTEKEVLREMLRYFSQIQLKKEDPKPFLDEIWQRSYLLRQISMDSYDFLHQSFQEYFTALELKEQEEGISTIINHLLEPWWEEPILLYAGISKDATALIKRIQKEVPEDIFYSNLMLFGKCVADAEFTEPSLREKIVNDLWSLYQTAEFAPLKEKAINVLALTKPDNIIDSLIKDLKDKASAVRESAADALGRIGSDRAIEPLIKAISTDKASYVRMSAADALGRIGSERAIEPLIKAISTDGAVRESAAYALGWIGSERAIEPLIKAISTDGAVRESAAYALGWIGSERAIEPLIKAISTDEVSAVRMSAAYALGWIGSERAIEPLIKAISTDEVSAVRMSAAYALGSIGSERAIEPLIKAISTDEVSDVRWSAAYALGSIGSEGAIEPLIKAISTDEDSDVRWSAAYALGRIGSERAIEPLIKAISTDEDSDVQESAAYALGRIGSERAIEPLIKAISTDKAGDVRKSAADALGRIGDNRAVEPLKKALKNEVLKDEAFTALEKISRRIHERITKEQS